jgi:regulator of replication initiation timing
LFHESETKNIIVQRDLEKERKENCELNSMISDLTQENVSLRLENSELAAKFAKQEEKLRLLINDQKERGQDNRIKKRKKTKELADLKDNVKRMRFYETDDRQEELSSNTSCSSSSNSDYSEEELVGEY